MEKQEHERLLALFALALVSQLPPDIARQIAAQLGDLGRMSQQDGDATVGTAAINLARLLEASASIGR